jgi:hypothetical protein
MALRFCAFRNASILKIKLGRSVDAYIVNGPSIFGERIMLDQGSLAKTIHGYRFGGVVAACIAFLIS